MVYEVWSKKRNPVVTIVFSTVLQDFFLKFCCMCQLGRIDNWTRVFFLSGWSKSQEVFWKHRIQSIHISYYIIVLPKYVAIYYAL